MAVTVKARVPKNGKNRKITPTATPSRPDKIRAHQRSRLLRAPRIPERIEATPSAKANAANTNAAANKVGPGKASATMPSSTSRTPRKANQPQLRVAK